jgi:CRISPR-associated protein (TIGR02584 family)
MRKGRFQEVFVFVAGTTPQVITETIYALSRKKPPVYADEIYFITTVAGQRRIEDSLMRASVLAELAGEYNIPIPEITAKSFLIVRDRNNRPLNDIRNEKENEYVGDLITSFIRKKAEDLSNRLHCSIAGGRKTMSFYIGAALQLFGRPWDRLYHVLVTPEFESNPNFFYIPKKERDLEVRRPDGTTTVVSTRSAEIRLAELPFIRLRSRLSLHGKGFQELVAEGQREIDGALLQPEIRINLSGRTVRVAGIPITMSPVQLTIYTAMLRQKIDHCSRGEGQHCGDCSDCFVTLPDLGEINRLRAMARDYGAIFDGMPSRGEELLQRWAKSFAPDIVRQNISKINRAVRSQIPDTALHPFCLITSIKKYGGTRYGVRADRDRIGIE